MGSISTRTRGEVRIDKPRHYKNFVFQEVDGVEQLVESEPVAPALASEYSVTINALSQKKITPRGSRYNVDAVDLSETLEKLK